MLHSDRAENGSPHPLDTFFSISVKHRTLKGDVILMGRRENEDALDDAGGGLMATKVSILSAVAFVATIGG